MYNIILGIIFVFGGMSGEMVLIGTNSGLALTVVGFILIALGIRSFKGSNNE